MASRVLKNRWLTLASMLALASAASVNTAGCSSAPVEEVDASNDSITQVDHSAVKRQSIGNCWIYATASWLEALEKRATGEEKNTSESWLTYWHWYEEITNGSARTEISTGGSYGTAAGLITRYGLVLERDFIASEGEDEMSKRQSTALAAINESIKNGALKDPDAQRDPKIVRKELDLAWGLDEETVKRINDVFGEDVAQRLDDSEVASEKAAANKIIRAKDFPARLIDPETKELVTGTLLDAMGTAESEWADREGKFAWTERSYPRTAAKRRTFWKSVQRALHDEMPVISRWKVDFNALNKSSRFSMAELERRGPGKQGGHLTVMHDYQADVPGVGLLKAGEQATREQMEAALSDDTKIEFVRVKNSWGGIRPDRWAEAAIPGYHDLELAYLNGPIKECADGPNGQTDTTDCEDEVTPLKGVVLPAGY